MQTTFIKIEGYAFDPKEVMVPVGTQIRWDNYDSVSHSLESYDSYDDSFRVGPILPNTPAMIILEKQGKVQYWCIDHHEMGVINVVE